MCALLCRVQICTVSDTLPTLQPRRRSDCPCAACLVSSADWCSVSIVRAVICFASGTACATACDVQAVRVRWRVQGGTGGAYSRRLAPPGQSSHHRKNKKGSKIIPTPIANLKNFPQKQKDPYKGSAFCAILALQALKGRNLQWLKVK
nr:MAG TPA: hypothetical protein [Caudoviricetes sp.]